jgi:tryptophan synthase beta chain
MSQIDGSGAFSSMTMAAMAPVHASGFIAASCQLVHTPRALNYAGVTKTNNQSSSKHALIQVRCSLNPEDVHVTRDDQTYMGFKRPDLFGKYGVYGGKYVPETLMAALIHLEVAYRATIRDPDFQVETIFLL